jgi:hypothetical protein
MGSGGIVPLFWISALEEGKLFSFTHQLLSPLGKVQCTHCIGGWVGPRAESPHALSKKWEKKRKKRKNCVLLPFVLNEYETVSHYGGRTQTEDNSEQGDKIL